MHFMHICIFYIHYQLIPQALSHLKKYMRRLNSLQWSTLQPAWQCWDQRGHDWCTEPVKVQRAAFVWVKEAKQKNEMNDSEMLMQVGNYLGVAWCGNYLFNPDSEPTKYGQCCGPFATQILKPWPVYPFDPFDSFEEFTSPAKHRKTIYI